MSQIAAALARSKGKKVDPVPPADSVVPAIHTSTPPMPPPAAPAEPAKPRFSPRDIACASAAGIAVLVVLFLLFRPAPKPAPPAPKPPVAVAAPAAAAPVAPLAAPAPAPVPKADAPPAEAAPAPGFSPDLEAQLKALVISARRTGGDPRIVVGGKVFAPGDEVVPGVVLDSVHADKVVFRDAAKNKFERR